jgi:anthranilate synthase component 1
MLKEYKTPKFSYMPPFTGGFVGYFSYEMISYFEPVLKLKQSEFNDFDLMLFDKVIAYDTFKTKNNSNSKYENKRRGKRLSKGSKGN